MKKIISLILSIFIIVFMIACNTDTPPDNGGEEQDDYHYVSLLTDKKYEKGFWMRGLGTPIYNDPIETFGHSTDPGVKFQYEKSDLDDPDWNLCQWATRYPFHDINNTSAYLPDGKVDYKFTKISDGQYEYYNSSKTLKMNTNTGEYSLGLKASECFKYPRTAGQEWPHWFTEKRIYNVSNPPLQCKISESQSLKVKLDVKMNSFVDHMGESADPGLHSAMCVLYLFVANRNPSSGVFSDMLWFGLTIFDNRYLLANTQSFPDVGSKASASEKWIYNISGTNFFTIEYNLKTPDGDVIFDEWRTVDVDVLELIQTAFSDAQRNNYMVNSKWENLYINGMYCGYETPGTYDIDMSFKNLDITSQIKK